MAILVFIFNSLKFNLNFNQALIELVTLKHCLILYTLMYDCVSGSELNHDTEHTIYETPRG
jgi:hypothetical protein